MQLNNKAQLLTSSVKNCRNPATLVRCIRPIKSRSLLGIFFIQQVDRCYTKKTKMLRITLFLTIIVLIFSCHPKKIESGNLISASGFVIDTVKNKKLSGVNLTIYSCKYTWTGYYETDSITSTTTDKDGNFSLSFKTDGNSPAYSLRFEPYYNKKYLEDQSQKRVMLKIGDNNILKIKAREYIQLISRIKIIENRFDTLQLDDENYNLSGIVFYNKHQIDTTLFLKVLPMNKYILSLKTWDSKNNNFFKRILDTINTTMNDTNYYSKTIDKL
jgi:hypothetical protein